jgi:hypothetical protein
MDAKFSVTIGSTIGIDCLKSCVGHSVAVPKFLVYLGKKALIFAISFLETRIN